MIITFVFALLKIMLIIVYKKNNHKKIIVLSGYCKHSLSGVICNIPATHRLSNIAPNMGPCGSQNSDVKRVEKCASIYTQCF